MVKIPSQKKKKNKKSAKNINRQLILVTNQKFIHFDINTLIQSIHFDDKEFKSIVQIIENQSTDL